MNCTNCNHELTDIAEMDQYKLCHHCYCKTMNTTATDECEYCGRPKDGEQLIATNHNGLVCADCDETKPWKY